MSTILLVERQKNSLTGALSEAGFCVRWEQDGREAISAADASHIDAAIIDVDLADLTAARVAHELRARDPELPIFVCTAFDEDAVTRWAVEDRMLVLEKPVDEARLVWLLQAHVGNLV
ncbi:MAG TPA: response regulator [Steroidobacter sp.]|uniref:response regulator n=1 Tax=Steroidobacter sp. TaxID=1978227 RepID=UPI002ED9C709